ncbi:hypothetical protein V5799_018153 [Amblyomma americanum]|uniref:Uncharacterized protein n=1 Tax=Amblyomma americanum TaxID=6943 RepID=A0AAQ4F090_AMBAM
MGNTTQNSKAMTAAVPETPITSPGVVRVKASSSFLPVVGAFLGAAISTFFLVLVAMAVLSRSKSDPSIQTVSSFCCTDEALTVLRVLDLGTDPCEDFYAHVCSRVDAGAPEHLSPIFRATMKRKLVEWGAETPGPSAAAQMLAALKKPIREEEELLGEDIAVFVTAIAQVAAVNKKMELPHAVRLFAELSVRYGLPTVVSITVSEDGTVATIRKNDGCVLDTDQTDDLGTAVDSFNKALNDVVTLQQLQQLEDQLSSTQGSNKAPKTVSRSIDLSPFSGLSEREWQAIVQDLILSLHPNVTAVKTQEEDRLSEFLEILVKAPGQSTTLAYAVICTALMSRDKLYDVLPADAANGISCELLRVCEVEEAFFAEALSSSRMDKYVRGLFAKIRLNVIDQAAVHPMLGGASKGQISQELNKLRVMVPAEIVASDIQVPNVSKTFFASLLGARSYVFDVRKTMLSRKIPDANSLSLPAIARRGDVIYVPTNVYALLGHKPSRVAALGIPVVGVDMAAEMWSFLLERPWPKEISKSIETGLECFAQKPSNHSHHDESLRTATVALGVASAIDAMITTEWDTAAVVNHTAVSLGQLVYLKWLYDRCASLEELVPRLDVNSALRNSPAFVKFFGCSKSAAMAAPNCCLKSC